MNRIAKFEKVSLKQFREGWTDIFGPADEDEVEAIYSQIDLPRRATAGSAGYDFYAPANIILADPYRYPGLDGAGMGAEMLSQKRTWIQIQTSAEQYSWDH